MDSIFNRISSGGGIDGRGEYITNPSHDAKSYSESNWDGRHEQTGWLSSTIYGTEDCEHEDT